MQGLYEAVRARLADGRCPAIIQAATVLKSDVADTVALGAAVTALVAPLSDTADPVDGASFIFSQRESWRFGVTLALTYPAGFPEFEPARDQIKAALRGWMAPGTVRPIEYAGGRLLQYDAHQQGGLWLHLLEFKTTVQETYEVQP